VITIDAVSEVGQVLVSMRGVFDGVEPVDELDHALQCAGHALAAGEDDGLVVACLLHDVARSPLLPQDGDHERVAAQWLAPRFGERVAWLAGAHVAAKVHLVATDPSYVLSEESRRSLAFQQQPPEHWLTDPLWPEAVRLRSYDDRAKVVGAKAPSLMDALAVVARCA
jgi:predicted HD phosphohydrolase